MIRRIAWVVLCLVLPLGASADYEPSELVADLLAPVLDPGSAVWLANVELEMGPGRFSIERGFLIPARLDDGRAVEIVFVGQARFRTEPDDPIESAQLELFTGKRSLDAAVDEAVLVLADGATVARLLDRPRGQAPRPELLDRAVALHSEWLDRPERRLTGVPASMFKALIGDAAYQSYFAAWCSSFEVGEFFYRFDPEDVEQIALARYNAPELNYRQRQELLRYMRVQRRRGRWLGLRVEDMGAWDIWNSASWESAGAKRAGGEGFESRHYELDVTIRRRTRKLEGHARIELITQAAGRRIVRVELFHDARVERVTDGEGQELFHFRSGEEVVVLLGSSPAKGEEIELRLEFGGRMLQWVDGRNYDLADTGTWYPHVGTLDRATYDVTLRWPRRYQLFSGGELVDGGEDGAYRWERRTLDVPSIASSFVIGRYDIERLQVGNVEIKVAFSRTGDLRTTARSRAAVVETVRKSLEFFQEAFGPYPLDELTVVTVPRRFSQSYLGFVTLARSVVGFEGHFGASTSWLRDATIAHEIAHQWWGNLIGWWSYRDQWLSEGMANYAALLYDTHVDPSRSDLLSVMSAGWRESLTQTTLDGRTIESLGPIVLGNRLNSSRASDAYRPIVYRKGAAVLAMMARAVGEDRFLEMLREISLAAKNQVLTTEAFMKSVERMSGLDLEGFARQYVYGTGIPQVYYNYRAEQDDDGGWNLLGHATRLTEPVYRYRIVQSPEGDMELARERIEPIESRETSLMVPFRVRVEALSGDDAALGWRAGRLVIEGDSEEFEIATGTRPGEFRLDPGGEILANFYSADRDAKRFLRYRAQDLEVAGRFEEAEAAYLDALEVPPVLDEFGDRLVSASMSRDEREDVRIRLALTRLWLEQGRRERAHGELSRIESDLEGANRSLYRVERDVLHSRLDMLDENYSAARRRLKKTLRLAAPKHSGGVLDLMQQIRLNSERRAVTEAFGLMVIAAHRTGRLDELEWATNAARDRGIQVPGDRSAVVPRSSILSP